MGWAVQNLAKTKRQYGSATHHFVSFSSTHAIFARDGTTLDWLSFESVVLMPKPTCTSWAMEELLEPWVHYIPLRDDLSGIEIQVFHLDAKGTTVHTLRRLTKT